ncbi:amidohydrolase [Kosmotoga sp.]|uniref:amidohydrolase n=1 Tax=Kosmotoga sp. TaxID=1955248 RepID=UPI0024AC1DB7|nr:amidohydrolase [Kosmotoga sp.]MDI3524320.1 5-methylthioadenosine/S-adenosylhomocysteine deaminase [Kosmotoga sp.]MDK2953496.1 5-methylthioadenosine/S-adenosylhomocysteine deaminase [Kosmotoga sp.]
MIIRNVAILTNDPKMRIIKNGIVQFKQGRILKVGHADEVKPEMPDKVIDGKGGMVLPAMVNAHYSIYSSIVDYPGRIDVENVSGVNYFSKLIDVVQENSWGRLILLSTMLGVIRALQRGTTTIFGPIPYSEDVQPKDFKEIAHHFGVNMSVGPVVNKENLMTVLNSWGTVEPDELFMPAIYITDLSSYTEEELSEIKFFITRNLNVNLVIFDMKLDNDLSLSRWGEQLTERLLENGLLVPECGITYGGNFSETDMDIIASRQMFVTKSIRSEMLAGTFSPNIAGLLGRGILVCLGSGLLDADLFSESQQILLTERFYGKFDIKVIDYEIRKTLFDNNFRIARRFFDRKLGALKEGASADIVLAFPKNDIGYANLEDLTTLRFVMRFSQDFKIENVWNQGELVLENGKPAKLSEEELNNLYDEIRKLEL